MTPYVFVRHGQSVANAAGWLSGWDDVALTEAGEAQARDAAARLHLTTFGRCLVSDLGRARRTAELILAGRVVPVHVVADLRERNMGAFQGESIAGVRADGRMERHMLGFTTRPPGGESHADLLRRAVAALRHWHDGTPTLVVAHGTLVKDLVAWLDGVHPDEIGRLPSVPNGEPIAREVATWPRPP